MLEMLMSQRRVLAGKPDFGYNFDKMVSTGDQAITITNASGYRKTASPAINGYATTLFGTGSPTFPIVPNTVFNYLTGDFTVEVVFLISSSTAGYTTIFAQNNGNNVGLVIRLGDGGYGNRLQVSTNPANASLVYSTPLTRSDLYNKWTHIAVQRLNGKISVYINGSLSGLASGTGSSYTTTPQPSTESLNLSGSNTLALITQGGSCITEFAVSKVAKYNANFVPSFPLYAVA